MLLMFGYVVGSDIKNLKLAVVDSDHTVQSQQVIDAFTSSGYFTLVAQPESQAQLKQVMDGSQAIIAIDIPKGFSDSITQKRSTQIGIIIDGSDSRTSGVANAYATGIISSLSSRLYPQTAAAMKSAGGVDSQVRILYNPTLRAERIPVERAVLQDIAFSALEDAQSSRKLLVERIENNHILEQVALARLANCQREGQRYGSNGDGCHHDGGEEHHPIIGFPPVQSGSNQQIDQQRQSQLERSQPAVLLKGQTQRRKRFHSVRAETISRTKRRPKPAFNLFSRLGVANLLHQRTWLTFANCG